MAKKCVLVAYGTRPEAIKMAPVVQALSASTVVEPIVVVSGQHREMLDQVNELFGIVPRADLDLMRDAQTLTHTTVRSLAGFSDFIDEHPVDAVVVQGDTSTSFAAALAGFYAKVPVAHVEAGLRTGHRYSPFPEEINRRLTAQLASLHLAPTVRAQRNLVDEGMSEGTVLVTGNTVVDALHYAAELRHLTGDDTVDGAVADGRRIVLVTAHRRESWGEGMDAIGKAVARIATSRPDLLVVVPAHRNPVVREHLLPPVDAVENVRVLEPLPYGAFAHLLSRSTLVLTDSGGIQEEAPTFGVPVLVMRDSTERPEAITARAAKLVGTRTPDIVDHALDLLDDQFEYARMADAGNPFGDGRAGRRTCAMIEHLLGLGQRPDEFVPQVAAEPVPA